METRYNGNVQPFGINATTGERTIFGDWNTSSDDIDANLNADFLLGWEAGLEGTTNPYPPSQYFNAVNFTTGKLISYLYQQGISKWIALQNYYVGSIVVGSDNNIYIAQTGTEATPNLGNNPTTDSTNWKTVLTASQILTLLKTVDGSGSGLDSDLLDGQQSTYYRNASNINSGILSKNYMESSTTPYRSIELDNTIDLNNLQTAGFYHQTSNADTSLDRNYPESKAGSLLVQNSAGVTQLYITFDGTPETYFRSFYSNNWSNWEKIYHSGNLPTFNTIIGTDSDINTSGATIIDNIYVTDGVITSMGTRTLTPADIGAQPAGTYNTVIGTDSDMDTSGATIPDRFYFTDGVCTSHGTRTLTAGDIGAEKVVASSFGTNGYIKYASGLIIQWGVSSSETTTFPISFPSACRFVDYSYTSVYNEVVPHVTTKSKTNFTVSSAASTRTKNWIAIGY